MKKMMVEAASQGEAQWTYQPDHTVAGKTGTSQVANPGGYDSTKTIASFIGFAPADQPKFLMLIKLIEPSTSPWAAETAAPLWYTVAEDLYLLLNIPPDKTP
jgi:cell division protein FtsI/penicillin-binding protein 2